MQCHLPPFRVKDTNNNEELMEASLFLFTNKMAVLRLSLSIDDGNSKPLYDNDYDEFISEVSNPCDLPFFPKKNSVDAIAEAYIRNLLSWGKFEEIALGGSIEHIMLSDFDLSPDNIDGISDELKESLFRISAAPVQQREDVSWLNKADMYLQENALIKNGMMYIATGAVAADQIIPNDKACEVIKTVDFSDIDYSSYRLKKVDFNGIAVDQNGFIYALDTTFGRVFIYDV